MGLHHLALAYRCMRCCCPTVQQQLFQDSAACRDAAAKQQQQQQHKSILDTTGALARGAKAEPVISTAGAPTAASIALAALPVEALQVPPKVSCQRQGQADSQGKAQV